MSFFVTRYTEASQRISKEIISIFVGSDVQMSPLEVQFQFPLVHFTKKIGGGFF